MLNGFERCEAVTLKWEGMYSHNPDDPGGDTMRGITQAVYDSDRKARGLPNQPVKRITSDEINRIYRTKYWDTVDCDVLPAGIDLVVFDAAVNSGPARAKKWLSTSRNIDQFCDARLEFLAGTGKLWQVFGLGWRRRVAGIRNEGKKMAGETNTTAPVAVDTSLHAGMTSAAVQAMQQKLLALGYRLGISDGIFGLQTLSAVKAFQAANGLTVDGVWLDSFNALQKGPTVDTTTPNVALAVQGTNVTQTSLLTHILALIGSTGTGVGATVMAFLAPSWSQVIVEGLLAAGGFLTAGAVGASLLHLNNTAVTATFRTAEAILNGGLKLFGSTPRDFDDDGFVQGATDTPVALAA